jgi:hypothetical protein
VLSYHDVDPGTWIDAWVYHYLRMRYDDHWVWYWLNWQINRELLF